MRKSKFHEDHDRSSRSSRRCSCCPWSGIASAQTDFSGEWTVVRSMDNTENPWVGDFVGLPLNADGLARAEGWDASLLSLPEYQCRPHGWAYIYRGPTQLRITKEVDPFSREVVAYQPEWHQSTNMPVYLDGREGPPAEANHTWGGFSTATWEGDILRIKTTHLKEDYIRRNGAMVSDQATVTSFWIRRGDILTWINIVHDPGVSVGAADSQLRIPPQRELAGAGAPVHVGLRGARERQRAALSAGRESVPQESPRPIRPGAECADRRRATMYPEYLKNLQPSEWTAGDRRGSTAPAGGAAAPAAGGGR